MTEAQLRKLDGKKIRFTILDAPYSIHSRELKGLVSYYPEVMAKSKKAENGIYVSETKIKFHYNMVLFQEDGYECNGDIVIPWNKLRLITKWEIIDEKN